MAWYADAYRISGNIHRIVPPPVWLLAGHVSIEAGRPDSWSAGVRRDAWSSDRRFPEMKSGSRARWRATRFALMDWRWVYWTSHHPLSLQETQITSLLPAWNRALAVFNPSPMS